MPVSPRRRLPFAERLAFVGVLLALWLRTLLPALHDHGPCHGGGPVPAPATAACSCGHHHAATPARGTAEDRAQPATGVLPPCHCLACELEVGVPGALPPPPAELVRSGAVRALQPLQRSDPARDRARAYASRAPPAATAAASVAG
ncbi:MAG: hypothetical protein JNL08_14650 [Planctomycetes bacterium]|nr:hypothetical protein [Planctomycetota bacterium]